MRNVFILSPARCSGIRASYLFKPGARGKLARSLESGGAAPIGEIFVFMSGLYFRGKIAYATAFGGGEPPLVIAPGRGLLSATEQVTLDELRDMASVPVDLREPAYRRPLVRDARRLARCLAPEDRAVLLGSIATEKYLSPLGEALGARLHYPRLFVGRGEMSRGALLLRCVRSGCELDCIRVSSAGPPPRSRGRSRPPRESPAPPRR